MTSHQWHERGIERNVSQPQESHPEKDIFQKETFKMSNLHGGSSFHSSEHSNSEKYVKDLGFDPLKRPSPQEKCENEVDYYHNPTELFRWINYRKWGGAWARVQTNPEECSTWVVSRHSSDGRVLWRHLPLHLVCMQSSIPIGSECSSEKDDARDDSTHPNLMEANTSNPHRHMQCRQLERLVEEILFTYPKAAKAQDDQGMLPLHQCINSSNSNTCINERVLMMLLIVNPVGLTTRDKHGQSALDMLMAKRTTVPGIETIVRIANNANLMIESIADSVSDEARKELATLRRRTDNERQASQRIIARLEDELADEHRRANKENNSFGEMKMQSNAMQMDLNRLKKNYESLELDLDQVRRERDDLITTNKNLREQVDKQEEIVADIRRRAEMDCTEQSKMISTLKSEANTARAMVDAVENQLRSKFSNEQELSSAVNVLEKKVASLTSTYQKEKKNLQNEIERMQEEKKMKTITIEELNKKIDSLQIRNNNLNKNVEDVLFSHSALAAEYDKVLDSSKRYESRVLESFQLERENLVTSTEKHKKIFDTMMKEQKQMIDEAHQKEMELTELINSERKKQHDSMHTIREDYQRIRTHVSSHQIKLPIINVPKRDATVVSRSNRAPSPGGLSSQEIFVAEKSSTLTAKQPSKPSNHQAIHRSTRMNNNDELNAEHQYANLHHDNDQSQPQSTQRSTNPSTQHSIHQQNRRINHSSEDITSSKGLVDYLEERSRQQRNHVRRFPSPPSSSASYDSAPLNHRSPMRESNISSSTARNKSNDFYTPSKHQEINHSMEMNQSNFTPQKSFSLDEYSDMESGSSSCTDATGNDYSGMTSAIKKGVIRLNPKPNPIRTKNSTTRTGIKSTSYNTPGHNNRPSSDHKIKSTLTSVDENGHTPQSMDAIRERFSTKQRSKYSVMDECGSIDTEVYGLSISSASDIMPLGNLKPSSYK